MSAVLAGVTVTSATAAAGVAAPGATPQWQLVGPNDSGGHLAFTPAAPSRLYVLPYVGHNVYRSDDHGLTWQTPGSFDVPDVVGNRLAADPRNADVVYAAATSPGTGRGYVLRSQDAGRTFHPVFDAPSGIVDVVVSASGQEIFAAGEAGVVASADRGTHWAPLAGAPAGVTRIALDKNDLFVGTDQGIHLVTDALGKHSTAAKLPVPVDARVDNLSVRNGLVVASSTLGAAVLSTDGGRSWTTVTGPWRPDAAVPYIGLTATGEIELQSVEGAADSSGARSLWISRDRGRSWTAKPAAMSKVDVYSDSGSFPDRPDEQVVSAATGIYTTRDSADFQRIGVPGNGVNALAVSAPSLLAGTSVGSYGSRAPLSANLPAGYQDWGWTGQAPPALGNSITALAALPHGGALRLRDAFCVDDCFKVERSDDGGFTWQTLSTAGGMGRALAVDPRNASKVYAGSQIDIGVYSSTDGGRTFELHQPAELLGVTSIAVDPRGDSSVWIGDVTGLYSSTDSGSTLTKVLDGDVERVAVDPADPSHVVAVGDTMIEVSHDGGRTFTAAADVPGLKYDDVTFAADGSVFAASRDFSQPGQGVFRSTDGGLHWSDVSATLPDRSVRAVVVSPDGQWLFAGTSSGVYRLGLR